MQRIAVSRVVDSVSRLNRKFAHTLQNVGDFLQRAFSGLYQRNAVVSVADGLVETTHLRGHAVRNREAGGIVFCRVNALTGGQTFTGTIKGVTRVHQLALRIDGRDVRVND